MSGIDRTNSSYEKASKPTINRWSNGKLVETFEFNSEAERSKWMFANGILTFDEYVGTINVVVKEHKSHEDTEVWALEVDGEPAAYMATAEGDDFLVYQGQVIDAIIEAERLNPVVCAVGYMLETTI